MTKKKKTLSFKLIKNTLSKLKRKKPKVEKDEAPKECPVCSFTSEHKKKLATHITQCLQKLEKEEKLKKMKQDEKVANLLSIVENEKCPAALLSACLQDGDVEVMRCFICQVAFPVVNMDVHMTECRLNNQIPDTISHCPLCFRLFLSKKLVKHVECCCGARRFCNLCNSYIPMNQAKEHSSWCMNNAAEEQHRDEAEKAAIRQARECINLLAPSQKNALLYVQQIASVASEDKYQPLLNRFIRLGYNENCLKRTLKYIRNEAPIIIHINLDKVLKHLVSDTHYRNQFETHTSGGTLNQRVRSSWESRLFNKTYDKSCPVDRVKYGSLNVINDPRGVRCCAQYGDSFLLLKTEVRYRTTFASKDSGSSDVKQLACCESYCHVLHQYNDKELEAVISVALGYEFHKPSTTLASYKEVQIHGPIQLDRDIEALFVHGRHRGNKDLEDLIERFGKQNNCNLIWIETDVNS